MNPSRSFSLAASFLALAAAPGFADVKVVANHNRNSQAEKEFKFKDVPSPAENDAATRIRFAITDGERDGNGAGPRSLTNGLLPEEQDQPDANFFFSQGSDGGILVIDLGSPTDVTQVNTYSWHPSTRGPQVYTLYASDGSGKDFDAKPRRAGGKLEDRGWNRLASVDTRPRKDDGAKPIEAGADGGGQHGVSVRDTSGGSLGNHRYVLLDIHRTEADDSFGNTFYCEIDVVAAPKAPGSSKADPNKPIVARTRNGKYEVSIDASAAPDLAGWAQDKLAPTLIQWYPVIVEMLPSDGFQAPMKVDVVLKPSGKDPAGTSGTTITCSADWLKKNLEGEATGAVVHELVHVAQQYGRGGSNATKAPGWLTEGIADYIRWYRYEPDAKGAERVRGDARYDAGYRTTANFLNYLTQRYDRQLVSKLNAALREGKPTDSIWRDSTGKTLEELGKEWKDQLPR